MRNMQLAVMDGLVSGFKESRRITIRELCETLHTLVILQLVAGRLERQVVTVVAEPKSHYRVLGRSEEHTSELQSLAYLVCRLLLEKKKINSTKNKDKQ